MPECVERVIEVVFGLTVFMNAVVFVPQAWKLYKVKSAEGLSLLMFVGFHFMQIFTILHGYIRKDYILVYGFILTFLLSSVNTYLILLYRKK